MAEGVARAMFPAWRIQSAGSKPATVNPFAVRALAELGLDAKTHASKSVDSIDPASVDTVITLCAEEVCPVFFGKAERIHWPLPDPAGHAGTDEEQLRRFREVREEIRRRLAAWGRSVGTEPAPLMERPAISGGPSTKEQRST